MFKFFKKPVKPVQQIDDLTARLIAGTDDLLQKAK